MSAAVPTRVIFRCEFCATAPDPPTQLALERQLREMAWRSTDTDRAIRHGGLSGMPKWGLS